MRGFAFSHPVHQYKDDPHPDPVARVPSETADEGALGPKTHDIAEPDGAEKAAKSVHDSDAKEAKDKGAKESAGDHATDSQTRLPPNGGDRATPERDPKGSQRRAARGAEPFEKWEREEMEALLGELCGHLGMIDTSFTRSAGFLTTLKSYTLRASSRARMLRTISYSTRTGTFMR